MASIQRSTSWNLNCILMRKTIENFLSDAKTTTTTTTSILHFITEIRSRIFIATAMVRSTNTICKSITIRIFKCDSSSRGYMAARHLLHYAWRLQGSNYSDAFRIANLSKWHHQLPNEVRYVNIKPFLLFNIIIIDKIVFWICCLFFFVCKQNSKNHISLNCFFVLFTDDI